MFRIHGHFVAYTHVAAQMLLLRYYAKPPALDASLARFASNLVPLALVLHLALAGASLADSANFSLWEHLVPICALTSLQLSCARSVDARRSRCARDGDICARAACKRPGAAP